jgi:hypothetical protein
MSRLNNADFPTLGRPTMVTFGISLRYAELWRRSGEFCVGVAFSLQLTNSIGDVDDA